MRSPAPTILLHSIPVVCSSPSFDHNTSSEQSPGIGRSTPQAQRFPDALSSALWGENSLASLLPALSIPGNIGLTIAKGEVTNAIYGQNAASYLRHINTPNTAADMLQILHAYGQDKLTYYGISCVPKSEHKISIADICSDVA